MSKDLNRAKQAYEFMVTAKQQDYMISREAFPELYSAYTELYDEIHAFAELENLQVFRSYENYRIYLVPNLEHRHNYTNSQLAKKWGFHEVREIFLSDFATLVLIHLFFDPLAVKMKISNFVSLETWQQAVTDQLRQLLTLQQTNEADYVPGGFNLEELNASWEALFLEKEEGVRQKDSRIGFLEKVSRGLASFGLLEIDKDLKESVGDYDLIPTLTFEDKTKFLLTKPTTMAFLSQLNREIKTQSLSKL